MNSDLQDPQLSNLTDEYLMTLFYEGNENAFTLLVNRHLRALQHYASRLTRMDAEDVVQKAVITMYLSRPDHSHVWLPAGDDTTGQKSRRTVRPFQASENFQRWLFAIVRSTAIDQLRVTARSRHLFGDEERSGKGLVEDFPDPTAADLLAEALDDVSDGLTQMNAEVRAHRDVLRRHGMWARAFLPAQEEASDELVWRSGEADQQSKRDPREVHRNAD